MTDLIGGLRLRLIHDSFVYAVRDGLDELGWFDAGRQHLPLRFDAEPQQWDDPIRYNTLAVSTQGTDTEFTELGSNMVTNTIQAAVDLYAENDSIGLDVSNDIKDILRGRIATTVPRGMLPVYDFQQATPSVVVTAPIRDVSIARSTAAITRSRLRHWYEIRCFLDDSYLGADLYDGYPSSELFPSPDLYPMAS